MKQQQKSKAGFTLLEILLVVAAIGILAGIVIIAINPTKQLGDTRDSQRSMDVNTILSAVYQYALDNNGTLPAGITTTQAEICRTTGAVCAGAGLVDLGILTTNEKYLVSIPYDPQSVDPGAGYEIVKTANNRIKVVANGENKTIEATR